MKLCVNMSSFYCLQAAVSQKDASTDDAGAAKSGFGSRGHRRAPRRFGGWRGSRWAAGTSSRSVSICLLMLV